MRNVIFVIAMLSPAVAQTWIPITNGLAGLNVGVNSVIVDRTNPSTLYVQTVSAGFGNSTVTGVFKSTDAAATWHSLDGAAGAQSVALDPSNSSNLYVGTPQGVIKSRDRGVTWSDANAAAPGVIKLAIDPSTSSTIYALSSIFNQFSSPSSVTTIYKSTDSGATWNPLNTGLPGSAYVTVMLIAPSSPQTLYVFAPPFISGPNQPLTGGLIKSTDGGQTWTMLTGLPAMFINSMAIDPTTASTVYISTNGGLLKTIDGGQTWNPLSLGAPGYGAILMTIDPANPSTLYVVAQAFGPSGQSWSIFKSSDGGATFSSFKAGLPQFTGITSLVVDPGSPSGIYVGAVGINFVVGGAASGGAASGGVFKSTDGGETFSLSSNGLVSYDIRTLIAGVGDGNTLYAGGSSGVSESVDGGASWNNTGLTAFTGSLTADPANPNILYAETGRTNGCNSSESLLLASSDAGANWNNTASPLNSGCILNAAFAGSHPTPVIIDPGNSNTLYLGESDDQDGYSAILKSTDRGADWIAMFDWFDGLRGVVRAIAVDPAHSATVYAGLDGGLYKSTDGGVTWAATGLTQSAVQVVAIDPANSQIVYAASGTLSKSTDGGNTWSPINTGLEHTAVSALIIDRTNSQQLYVGTTSAGVLQSSDGGNHWTTLNNGLANLQIRALVRQSGTLYAANAASVFKLQ